MTDHPHIQRLVGREDYDHEWRYSRLSPSKLAEAANQVIQRYGDDLRLIRNSAENLNIHRPDGEWLGWIDLTRGVAEFPADWEEEEE